MIYPLSEPAFPLALPLFAGHENHLAPFAVLSGEAGWGQVWADNAVQPRAALLRSGRRYYLAGDPAIPTFNAALSRLFAAEGARPAETGEVDITGPSLALPQDPAIEFPLLVFFDDPAWEAVIEGEILPGKNSAHPPRRYFELRRQDGFGANTAQDWQELLRPGDQVVRIDPAFLADPSLGDLSHLREELASECRSVDFFLAHRFGFALLREGRLAGWCLSEYNLGDRCEIGIETLEPYQRQGVATVTTGALVEHAFTHGINRIGWDCWLRNEASVAAALRAGFEPVEEYPVFVAWL